MTRYRFAIKALPKGDKPFGDDDEDQDQDTANADGADSGATHESSVPAKSPVADRSADEALEEQADPDAATPEAAPDASTEESPPSEDLGGEEEPSEEAPTPVPEDDARPWSGDMYDEGDETVPSAAFAAYTSTSGEEAWLDQAPDGTLTGVGP